MKRLPIYVLAGLVLFSAFKVAHWEGLLAASIFMLLFAPLMD